MRPIVLSEWSSLSWQQAGLASAQITPGHRWWSSCPEWCRATKTKNLRKLPWKLAVNAKQCLARLHFAGILPFPVGNVWASVSFWFESHTTWLYLILKDIQKYSYICLLNFKAPIICLETVLLLASLNFLYISQFFAQQNKFQHS